MEVLDIGLVIPAIIIQTISTEMVFKRVKVLECLRLMEDVDIGLLIPEALSRNRVVYHSSDDGRGISRSQ